MKKKRKKLTQEEKLEVITKIKLQTNDMYNDYAKLGGKVPGNIKEAYDRYDTIIRMFGKLYEALEEQEDLLIIDVYRNKEGKS